MNKYYMELNKTIEKIINLRINEIIEKSDLDEKIINKIKDTNDIIVKNNKTIKKSKKNIVKKEYRKISIYAIYVKDANNIIKNNSHLNYLSNDIITEIKNIKDKSAKNQFKELGIIWKKIDNNIVDKYKKLTKDNNFTNEKYDNIVGTQISTSKISKKNKT